MATEQDKAVVQNFLDTAWHKRNINGLASLVTADFHLGGPLSENFPAGAAGITTFVSAFITGFPDVNYTIQKQEIDGDWVKTWITFTGTQNGTLMNIPPTGRNVNVPVIQYDRVVNGKIAESTSEWDPQGMMQQLGVA
jgi:steroid delta-isomerase-like uncharacterized protein